MAAFENWASGSPKTTCTEPDTPGIPFAIEPRSPTPAYDDALESVVEAASPLAFLYTPGPTLAAAIHPALPPEHLSLWPADDVRFAVKIALRESMDAREARLIFAEKEEQAEREKFKELLREVDKQRLKLSEKELESKKLRDSLADTEYVAVKNLPAAMEIHLENLVARGEARTFWDGKILDIIEKFEASGRRK